MKFVLRPQHRTAPRAETRIALFPFLAVLICTMGALVPLLMAITYVAKQQAEQEAKGSANGGGDGDEPTRSRSSRKRKRR